MEIKTTIENVINHLAREGLLENFQHNCVLASDVIQHMLDAQGVPSRLVEVTLAVSRPEPDGSKSLALVGYNFETHGNQIDTHVVVVTETPQPMLIDASIGHILRNANQVVVAPINDAADPVLCAVDAGTIGLTYRLKKSIRLPSIHQQNLVSRLRADGELQQRVRFLSIIVWILIGFGTVNFFLNVTQLTLKVLYP